MVSGRELNRWRVRETFGDRIFSLYMVVKKYGNFKISLSRKQALRFVCTNLKELGYTRREISSILNIDEADVTFTASKKFPTTFMLAVKLFRDPLELLKKSDYYGHEYYITKQGLEVIIIENLITAGLENRQIATALKTNIRRIQRVRKRMKEDNDD